MPRGFLVKRTKKAGPVSYRVRHGGEEAAPVAQGFPAPAMPRCWESLDRAAASRPTACPSLIQSIKSRIIFGGVPEALCAPSLSPNRPVSAGFVQQNPASADCLDRKLNSSSPVQAESFPEPNPCSFISLSGSKMAFPPSLAEMTSKLGSACSEPVSAALKRAVPAEPKAKQPHPKKSKTSGAAPSEKRPSYRDEVTNSPVLGLRIKEDPEEDAKPRSLASSPLGEFICQLCKERYSDPLSLAQHKCSRIVRVEYRCTECDKVFSCPANLASHRRWHKPKSPRADSSSPPPAGPQEERPCNPPPLPPSQGSKSRESSTPSPQPSDSDEELFFDCPQCCKKFRRQAYLRKHLALHSRQALSGQPAQVEGGAEKKARASQGVPQGSAPATAQAGALYLGRDSPVLPAGTPRAPAAAELFPCRFCGENFFSSPGLTRHINKCHPTETRHVLLLSQAAL